MGPYRSSPAVAVLLLTIFTVSSVLDMSIISYNNNLGDGKSTGSWRTDDEVMSIYEGWLAEHGKAYNTLGEKERRFQIFKDNLRYIDEQNSKTTSGGVGGATESDGGGDCRKKIKKAHDVTLASAWHHMGRLTPLSILGWPGDQLGLGAGQNAGLEWFHWVPGWFFGWVLAFLTPGGTALRKEGDLRNDFLPLR